MSELQHFKVTPELRAEYVRWLWKRRMLWFQRKPTAGFEWNPRLYVGLQRSGKTLLLVRDCIDLMRRGVRVYANLQIVDPLTGAASLPLGGWLDMLRASVGALEDGIPTVFAFDEIQNACDARSWQSTPTWWLMLVSQQGHFGVGLIATTHDVDDVEKRLRTLIGRIISVRKSGLRRLIPRLPLFVVQDVDMSLAAVPDADSGIGRWWPTWIGASAFGGYSTRELVPSLDFKDLTDDESKRVVRELTERAVELARPEVRSIFDSSLQTGASSC